MNVAVRDERCNAQFHLTDDDTNNNSRDPENDKDDQSEEKN